MISVKIRLRKYCCQSNIFYLIWSASSQKEREKERKVLKQLNTQGIRAMEYAQRMQPMSTKMNFHDMNIFQPHIN